MALRASVSNSNVTGSGSANIGPGTTISALGDSISVIGGANFPPTTSLAAVPLWQPNFNYAAAGFGLGTLVTNNGLLYVLTVAGTSAGSGGPTGQAPSGITDNTATWGYIAFSQTRTNREYLYWVEVFSQGNLKWNFSQGYSGIPGSVIKAIVVTPGTGYANTDTVNFNHGAYGRLNVDNKGAVTSVTITNPGSASGTGFGTPTITTSTGSGLTLSVVSQVGGNFGVPGCLTSDMVARLPDVTGAANRVDAIVIHGGTNDLGAGVSFANITANLRTCYESCASAGIRVIPMPISPRATSSPLTNAQLQLMVRVNRWIRAYARREAWANPKGVVVYLADATRYWTDGSSAINAPIGGVGGGVDGSMTLDGLHPSPRGAQYEALAIINAASSFVTPNPVPYSRIAGQYDGYDPVLNPGGNYLEALPWNANEVIVPGQKRSNTPNMYIAQVGGTTSAASPPTGTGTGITDGGVTWNFYRKMGGSVYNSGTKAISSGSGSTTTSGITDNNWAWNHLANSSPTATVIGSLESTTWSDGQTGQRQVLSMNMSGGANTEVMAFFYSNSAFAATDYGNFGILQADLGVTQFMVEMELELSGVQNLTSCQMMVLDNTSNYAFRYQEGINVFPGQAALTTMMNSNGDMLPYPNNGKLWLQSQPFILPASPSTISTLFITLQFGFDATVSASAVVKFNYFAWRKAGVA